MAVISLISCSRFFEFNVEAELVKTHLFQWYVGEGPLWWYRIEWKPRICEPNACSSEISTCTLVGPDPLCCDPLDDCGIGGCKVVDVEVWHMLATSLNHLCDRIHQECCQRRPPGFFKRVQRYLRPALCCDVEKFGAVDEWVDVDFIDCICADLIDPCDMTIFYPCSTISYCDQDVATFPVMAQEVKFQILAPVAPVVPVVFNRFGGAMPSILKLTHNLANANELKSFLQETKQKLPDTLSLVHNGNSWRQTYHLEPWVFTFDLTSVDEAENNKYGWKLDISVTKKKAISRLSFLLNSGGVRNDKGEFDISFNYNTKSQVFLARSGIGLQSKNIFDNIGLFKGKWQNDPYLKVKIFTE